MAEQQHDDSYYTAMVISKCFQDPDGLGQDFRTAYNTDPGAAQKMLVDMGMPEDLAKTVVSKQGNDLYNFVGARACDFLW